MNTPDHDPPQQQPDAVGALIREATEWLEALEKRLSRGTNPIGEVSKDYRQWIKDCLTRAKAIDTQGTRTKDIEAIQGQTDATEFWSRKPH